MIDLEIKQGLKGYSFYDIIIRCFGDWVGTYWNKKDDYLYFLSKFIQDISTYLWSVYLNYILPCEACESIRSPGKRETIWSKHFLYVYFIYIAYF